MLKASALFYAIVIAVLVALLSGSLILSAYFNRLENDTYILQEQLQRNAASGIDYLLSSQEEIKENDVTVDMYGEGDDSVTLGKTAWGVYEVLRSEASGHGNKTSLAALAGSIMQEKERYALWLADQDRPLSLAGSTVIKGDAYLPKAGVQRAYIEGQSYSGSSLVYGSTKLSSRSIPPFEELLADRLKKLVTGQFEDQDSITALTDDDSISRSFFENALVMHSPGLVILSGKTYSGHVVITSGKKIIVKKDAVLDNVLIAAPMIVIEDEFEGVMQAFAGDSLMIGKKCRLNYPSALGIVRSTKSADHILLSIGEETNVKGVVLSWQDTYDVRKSMLISIDKKAIVTGQVYASALLDLKGTVNGSVVASKLLLKTPSSVYENHLLNATIDITKLPKQFGGAVTEKSSKTVLKWMQ